MRMRRWMGGGAAVGLLVLAAEACGVGAPPASVGAVQPCQDSACQRPVVDNLVVRAPAVPEVERAVVVEIPAAKVTGPCPDGMVEIDEQYCARDDSKCLAWRNGIVGERCLEFTHPVHCLVPTVRKHFCADRFEIPNVEGERPRDWMSFWDAKRYCESQGKRMLTKTEWTTAAMGKDLWQVAYGDGFHRDSTACNMDRHSHGIDVMNVRSSDSVDGKALHQMVAPSGSFPLCKSETGLMDMDANLDEWVINESGRPYVSGLVGGHFYGVRCNSRAMTTAHGPDFRWYETSGRCALSIADDKP